MDVTWVLSKELGTSVLFALISISVKHVKKISTILTISWNSETLFALKYGWNKTSSRILNKIGTKWLSKSWRNNKKMMKTTSLLTIKLRNNLRDLQLSSKLLKTSLRWNLRSVRAKIPSKLNWKLRTKTLWALKIRLLKLWLLAPFSVLRKLYFHFSKLEKNISSKLNWKIPKLLDHIALKFNSSILMKKLTLKLSKFKSLTKNFLMN